MPINGNVCRGNYPDFSIYITHGGVSTIKSIARRFSGRNGPQILATYEDGIFSFVNSVQLSFSLECEEGKIPRSCSIDDFIDLIGWVKTQCFIDLPSVMLFMDPNLGVVGGKDISQPFLHLADRIAPRFLFACSGTPECIEKVEKYFAGEAVVIEAAEYRLPTQVLITEAADKDTIVSVIELALSRWALFAELPQADVSACYVAENPHDFEQLNDECSSQVAQFSDSDSQNRERRVRTFEHYFLSCVSFFRRRTTSISPEIFNEATTRNTEPSRFN
jgi:hypothetical protein